MVLQLADVHPGLDHRPVGPEIGPAQVGDAFLGLMAVDDRQAAPFDQGGLLRALHHQHPLAAQEHCPAAGGQMGLDHLALAVTGIEDHVAVAQRGHLRGQQVVGVEHGHPFGQHHVHLGAQYGVELLVVMNVVVSQRGGPGHAGDDAHLAAVIGQAVAHDSFRAVLDHRGIDHAIHQHALAGGPGGAVARLDTATVDEEALAAGQAHVAAAQVQ